ncbi:MAG TPA: cache domain-containing protein, partial [Blastocatellia bacterium]|nr:cache domain-containing protein [Blastocatellia bacterium]
MSTSITDNSSRKHEQNTSGADFLTLLSKLGLRSLRTKLFAGSLVAMALAIVTVSIVAFLGVRSAIYSGGQIEQTAKLTSEAVDIILFENMEFAKSVATDPMVVDRAEKGAAEAEKIGVKAPPADSEIASLEKRFIDTGALNLDSDLNSFLRDKRKLRPVMERMFFTDRYGLVVGSTGRTEDFVQSDETWWKTSMKSGFYLEDLGFDKPSGRWAVEVCMAIPHPKTGQPNGVLKAKYNLLDAQEYIGKFRQYQSGQAYVIGKSGTYVLHRDPSFWNKSINDAFAKSGIVVKAATEPAGTVTYEGANPDTKVRETRLAAYYTSKGYSRNGEVYPGFGWIVVVDNSIDEVYAPAFSTVGRIAIAGVILFLIVALLSYLFSSSFFRVIQKFLSATDQIRAGNLDARLRVTTRDELERVADGFNLM